MYLCLVVSQVQLCVRSCGSFGLKPSGCGPDTYDEPEGISSVPGNPGLYTTGQFLQLIKPNLTFPAELGLLKKILFMANKILWGLHTFTVFWITNTAKPQTNNNKFTFQTS